MIAASTVDPVWYLGLGALLFALGATGLLVRRNPLVMFMCVELMLNAVNLAIIAFGAFTLQLNVSASVIALIVMAAAAAEATVGLAIVIVVINVPYALHEYQLHRAATSGIRVSATVVGVTAAGSDTDVSFRLPTSIDAKQSIRTVKVNGDVGRRAAQTRQLSVRVVKGDPGAFHAEGQVRTWAGLIITVVADLLVAGMLLLSHFVGGLWRMGWQTALALGGTLVMSSTAIVVKLMSERQVRRMPIVDDQGRLTGIIAQADVATRVSRDATTGELVEAISEPGTVRR